MKTVPPPKRHIQKQSPGSISIELENLSSDTDFAEAEGDIRGLRQIIEISTIA
jgi:hypothetical protein